MYCCREYIKITEYIEKVGRLRFLFHQSSFSFDWIDLSFISIWIFIGIRYENDWKLALNSIQNNSTGIAANRKIDDSIHEIKYKNSSGLHRFPPAFLIPNNNNNHRVLIGKRGHFDYFFTTFSVPVETGKSFCIEVPSRINITITQGFPNFNITTQH